MNFDINFCPKVWYVCYSVPRLKFDSEFETRLEPRVSEFRFRDERSRNLWSSIIKFKDTVRPFGKYNNFKSMNAEKENTETDAIGDGGDGKRRKQKVNSLDGCSKSEKWRRLKPILDSVRMEAKRLNMEPEDLVPIIGHK